MLESGQKFKRYLLCILANSLGNLNLKVKLILSDIILLVFSNPKLL